MVRVAFHRLVLKYIFMLERRASSYIGCAAVVNTYHVLHHLFFSFSPVLLSFLWLPLNPPVFQYPLGIMDARTGCAFPSVITSVSDNSINDVLEGAEEGCFSAAPPWATLC